MSRPPAFPTRFSPRLSWAIMFLALGAILLSLHPVLGQDASPRVRLIEIDGTITPPMASYIDRAIRGAENDDAAAIVLRIDTPGGLSSAMDDIVSDILDSEVPVIAWVGPSNARAASAGVYITYASHIAAMAPNTNIGSASPVQGTGEDIDSTMERKVVNDAVARIENLAELRGRNVEWAIAAVRDAENITADRAQELGVVELVSPDIDTLLNDVDGMEVTLANGESVTLNTAGAQVSTTGMNAIESFLQLISEPTIAYLLLSFGSLGIFLELSNPGTFIPGIIGAVCFILGFYSLGTLPVNWTGLLLIGLGLALFFIEIFVTSFGILTVGGLAAFIVGSYMLIDESVPGYGVISRPVIWTSAGLVLAASLLVGFLVVRTQRRKPSTGKQGLIGQVGIARTDLSPSGMVYVEGELWSAIADGLAEGDILPRGSTVEVLRVDGLRLTVRRTSASVSHEVAEAGRRENITPVRGYP
jgi:membrane-bound serine protease (ClpP class)